MIWRQRYMNMQPRKSIWGMNMNLMSRSDLKYLETKELEDRDRETHL